MKMTCAPSILKPQVKPQVISQTSMEITGESIHLPTYRSNPQYFFFTMNRPKRPCDRCRLKKRKCDGKMPCSTCLKSRNNSGNCTYLDGTKKYNTVMPLNESNLNLNFNLNAKYPIKNYSFELQSLTYPELTTLQNPKTNTYSVHSLYALDNENSSSENACYLSQNILPRDEIKEHLLGLAFLYYSGQSSSHGDTGSAQIDWLSQSAWGQTIRSEYLQKALCFHSTFYSTLPSIIPQKTSFYEKLTIASNKYSIDPTCEQFIDQLDSSDYLRLCHDIQAILVHAVSQLSLGNSAGALDLICIRNLT